MPTVLGLRSASPIRLSLLPACSVSGPNSSICRTHPFPAASFYQAHPILIPYGSPTDSFIQHIQKVQPDILIAESSSTELESLLLERHGLSQIILVTRPDSDRERVAKMLEDTSNKVKVTTWHDLVGKRRSSATSELPQVENGSPSPSLSVVDSSEGRDSTGVIEYSSQVSYRLSIVRID